ncbi:MAG: LolA family protein [Lachnospirales bacterium]
MLKKYRFLSLLCITMICTSCSIPFTKSSKEDAYTNVHEKYTNMEGYSAKATVTYKARGDETVFEVLQWAKSDGRYNIEVTSPESVAGSTTIYDGEAIYQFNSNLSNDVYVYEEESPERLELFITSFIKNYEKADSASVTVANVKDSFYTVLEATIDEQHPFISTEKLWVNNLTLDPEKLVIYDKNNVETIIITFEDFVYNPNIDESIFTAPIK